MQKMELLFISIERIIQKVLSEVDEKVILQTKGVVAFNKSLKITYSL